MKSYLIVCYENLVVLELYAVKNNSLCQIHEVQGVVLKGVAGIGGYGLIVLEICFYSFCLYLNLINLTLLVSCIGGCCSSWRYAAAPTITKSPSSLNREHSRLS